MHTHSHQTVRIFHPFPHKDSNILGGVKFHKSPKPLLSHCPKPLSCNHASEKHGSGDGGVGGVGGGVVVDCACLSTLSAAVAAAEFLTVAISRTPK